MRTQLVVVAVVLAVTAIFAALNWGPLNAPAPINLLFTEIQGPLGLIMLALLALLVVLFVLFMVSMQVSFGMEARRQARELERQRALADQAEASRFTDLRNMLMDEFERLHGETGDGPVAIVQRLERTEARLTDKLEEIGNTMAAYIGELEDRIERRDAERNDSLVRSPRQ
jgi:uncharacterized integral membrane protein